jgi:coniferyl-aldehyde dehydrogenase
MSLNTTSASFTYEQLSALVQRQRQAHWQHPMPSCEQRLQWLGALERLLSEHDAALIEAVNADFGHRNPYETQLLEIKPVLSSITQARRSLNRWMRPQSRKANWLLYGRIHNQVVPEPLGVVGVITPWNFPLMLSLSPLVSILAAGNRAIVKYSEYSAHLSALLIELMPRYFDADVVTVLAETGQVGEWLSSMPLDHLIFTGSEKTARAVMRAATEHLTPLTLELGGKSPAVVAPDFDIQQACERILFGKLVNAGQVCVSVDHVYVPTASIATFVESAKQVAQHWYGSVASPDYTSLIHARSYERLQAMLDQAQHMGAQVVDLLPSLPEHAAAHRMAPKLVLNAPAECDLMQEEIFGPILPVLGYDDVHTVLQTLQQKAKPLAFYPFTHDRALLLQMLSMVQSGGVTINDTLLHVGQTDLPFGGVGASGQGHYHGYEGFVNFSKLRPITRQTAWSAMSLMYPPHRRFMSWFARWSKNLF